MRTLADVQRVMRALLLTPGSHGWGLVALFLGGPGGGKSSVPPALASELGLAYEWLSPAQRGEGAFGVVPVPDGAGDGMLLRYPPPDWVGRLTAGGLVLIDELTCAPPALQPALLGLLLDRRIGSAQLPAGVRLLAAANPVSSAAAGWDLPSATANRLIHLSWPDPDASEWSSWLAGVAAADLRRLAPAPAFLAGVDDEVLAARLAEEARVLGEWPAQWPRANALTAGFLRSRPSLLRQEPAAGSPDASGAWPSPRSWEVAARVIAGSMIHGLDDVLRDELVAGCVGEGAATEWSAWSAAADLPDLEALADGQVAWSPDVTRLDRTCAVSAGLAALIHGDVDRKRAKARATRCWKLFGALEDVDVVESFATAAVGCGAGTASCPEARAVLGRLTRTGLRD